MEYIMGTLENLYKEIYHVAALGYCPVYFRDTFGSKQTRPPKLPISILSSPEKDAVILDQMTANRRLYLI